MCWSEPQRQTVIKGVERSNLGLGFQEPLCLSVLSTKTDKNDKNDSKVCSVRVINYSSRKSKL